MKDPRGAHPAVVPVEAEGCLSRGLPEESCYLWRSQAEESLLRPQESAQLSSVLVPEWLYLGSALESSYWESALESSYWESAPEWPQSLLGSAPVSSCSGSVPE